MLGRHTVQIIYRNRRKITPRHLTTSYKCILKCVHNIPTYKKSVSHK